jgi:hypothetical protein
MVVDYTSTCYLHRDRDLFRVQKEDACISLSFTPNSIKFHATWDIVFESSVMSACPAVAYTQAPTIPNTTRNSVAQPSVPQAVRPIPLSLSLRVRASNLEKVRGPLVILSLTEPPEEVGSSFPTEVVSLGSRDPTAYWGATILVVMEMIALALDTFMLCNPVRGE